MNGFSNRAAAFIIPLLALAPAGRMPLTNYLAQSIIGTLFFDGYGLGFYNDLGPAFGVAFAVGVFALQVVWSRAWLARRELGPAEELWRALTYGRPRMAAVAQRV